VKHETVYKLATEAHGIKYCHVGGNYSQLSIVKIPGNLSFLKWPGYPAYKNVFFYSCPEYIEIMTGKMISSKWKYGVTHVGDMKFKYRY
jgi:hypothetical protein